MAAVTPTRPLWRLRLALRALARAIRRRRPDDGEGGAFLGMEP